MTVLAAFCLGAYLLCRVLAAAVVGRLDRAVFYRRTGFYLYR